MGKYEYCNAVPTLERICVLIDRLEKANKEWRYIDETMKFIGSTIVYDIRKVHKECGIFDWWIETLSISKLKKMKEFIETAIGMGYTGYVCFNVGAKYCSHGMWASKEESKDGFSPNGATLFRGFRNGDYNDWSACLDDGTWLHDDKHCYFTLKQVKNLLKTA